MKAMHTFFVLGSVGFVVTALLHMLIASLTGSASIVVWIPIYANWAVFICLGLLQMKRQATRDASPGCA